MKQNQALDVAQTRKEIYGIDFSGAKNAGKKIWLARGESRADGLRIDKCQRARDFLGVAQQRDICLAALRDFMASRKVAAFGVDFPFGLPKALAGGTGWALLLRSFPKRYKTPEQFYEETHRATCGREPKRVTDVVSKTPFSPINRRIFRQTYFGIHDVLAPLVCGRRACVLPMQKPRIGKPWILEVCPASTLKRLRSYKPYKGREDSKRAARRAILQTLEVTGPLAIADSLRSVVLDDPEGDALDSIIAAFATSRALFNPTVLVQHEVKGCSAEGHVYL